jgi:hypothetical protein
MNALDTEAPEYRMRVEVEGAVPQHPALTTQEQEPARRAAVAGPGSQAPGVTISDVALRRPQSKLPFNNQSPTASGQSSKEISTEVSVGTSLMTARKAAHLYMFWNINADPRKKGSPPLPMRRMFRVEGQTQHSTIPSIRALPRHRKMNGIMRK